MGGSPVVILGIDTSTSAIGVGLGRDGETLASAQRIDPEELGDPNLWLMGTTARDAAGRGGP